MRISNGDVDSFRIWTRTVPSSLRSHPHTSERYPGPFTNSFWRNFFVGVWGSLGGIFPTWPLRQNHAKSSSFSTQSSSIGEPNWRGKNGEIPCCSPLWRARNKYSWVWILDSLICQDIRQLVKSHQYQLQYPSKKFLQHDDLVISSSLIPNTFWRSCHLNYNLLLMVLSLPDSNLTFDQPPHLAKKLAECQDVKDCEVCVARVDHILDVHVSNHGGNRPDPTLLNNNFNKNTYVDVQQPSGRTKPNWFAKKLHKSACPNQSYGWVGWPHGWKLLSNPWVEAEFFFHKSLGPIQSDG